MGRAQGLPKIVIAGVVFSFISTVTFISTKISPESSEDQDSNRILFSRPSDSSYYPLDLGSDADIGLLDPDWSSGVMKKASSSGVGEFKQIEGNNTCTQSGVFGVCLDGCQPGYYFESGMTRSWIVHIQGGGWCNDCETCDRRADARAGSPNFMPPIARYQGILSSNPRINPDFHDWNRVYLAYCDGASFAGNRTKGVMCQDAPLYLQGQGVWSGIIRELFRLGLDSAQQVLLSGSSAGGLSALLHCDDFAAMFPSTTRVKCLSDSGFFYDVAPPSANFFRKVVEYHNPVMGKACLQDRGLLDQWQCFLPRYFSAYIQTPIFFLQSVYDPYGLPTALVSDNSANMTSQWWRCFFKGADCTPAQKEQWQDVRLNITDGITQSLKNDTDGAYLFSCTYHVMSLADSTWGGSNPSILVQGKTPSDVIGDWYFERSEKSYYVDLDNYLESPRCPPY